MALHFCNALRLRRKSKRFIKHFYDKFYLSFKIYIFFLNSWNQLQIWTAASSRLTNNLFWSNLRKQNFHLETLHHRHSHHHHQRRKWKWARAVPQIFSLCPKNKWKYLFLFLSRVATYVLTIYPSSKWEGNKKDRERETERKKEWEKEIVSNNSWIANLENCQAVLSNVRNISMRYTVRSFLHVIWILSDKLQFIRRRRRLCSSNMQAILHASEKCSQWRKKFAQSRDETSTIFNLRFLFWRNACYVAFHTLQYQGE